MNDPIDITLLRFEYMPSALTQKCHAVRTSPFARQNRPLAATGLTHCACCAGFPLNDQLCQMIVRRYSDESGNLDFDNYIGCLVRLDAMCRKWFET